MESVALNGPQLMLWTYLQQHPDRAVDDMWRTLSAVVWPEGRLLLRQGDLAREEVDALVNAANSQLQHGSGVAKALREAGGAEFERASRDYVAQHGPVPVGEAAVTAAGALPCRAVLHAVGPVWNERGDEASQRQLLARTVYNVLARASQLGFVSVALPAISSGVFGFPKVSSEVSIVFSFDFRRRRSVQP